ncbi:MAG: SulP family inorganic anion transporter [Pirellulaceae bacterium]|jgi:SulP family sulfate permease
MVLPQPGPVEVNRGPRGSGSTDWIAKVGRWIPAVESLRGYDAHLLRRDVVAGATVAAVAVPQAMAYATIFDMPMQMGLFTAIVMTGVGALLDSSRQLINGPTNAISIAMLSALSLTPPEKRVEAAILMALLIGIIQILITGMRLGDMSRYISHSVIVGFTLGASILLVMDQLKNILGLRAMGDPHDPFLLRFAKTFSQGGPIHWPTLAVAMGTILVAASLRWLNRRRGWQIPELLAALTVAAVVCAATGASDHGVRRIDQIPRELPAFSPPRVDWGLVRDLLPSAALIGMLGLLEAIAMAKSIAAKTHQKLNIHQQCLSEGVANLAGSFFHCFPGSGSLTRSYINHQAGAATQWSGVFSAAAVAVVILLFAPWAQYIPRAALAGVLMLTAIRMVDPQHLLYHLKATRFDAAIVLATALAAALVSIEFCILIGVFLSFFFYVPKAARLDCLEYQWDRFGKMQPRRSLAGAHSSSSSCDRWRFYHVEGELFFGASPDLEGMLERIEQELPEGVRFVLLRVRYARNPDAVCMELLERFLTSLSGRGIQLVLSGVGDDLRQVMARIGLDERIGRDRIFYEQQVEGSSTREAVLWIYRQLGDHRCATCTLGEMQKVPTTIDYDI